MIGATDTQKNKTDVKTLEGFVDRLIQEKGLDNLDSEILEEIKNDLISRLENRINAAILAALPPEKLEDFEKMLDQADSEEIQSFCSKNIPDLDQLTASELISFRRIYLGK